MIRVTTGAIHQKNRRQFSLMGSGLIFKISITRNRLNGSEVDSASDADLTPGKGHLET